MRHPSFQGLREDKPAKDVIREMPKSPAAMNGKHRQWRIANEANAPCQAARSVAQLQTPTSREQTKPPIAGVRLTHPDRVLYPDDKDSPSATWPSTTSASPIGFCRTSPTGRSRSFAVPEGYTGECFYQKHLTGSLPDAVAGVTIKEKGKQEEYVVIDDAAGLVSLVQMGVLEMHPWPAREDNVERPDYLVFDFDPGEGVDLESRGRKAPRDVRDRLEAAGLTTFLRTSGGKGLHVVVPLVTPQHLGRIQAVRQIGRRHDDPRRARPLHRHDEQSQTPRQDVRRLPAQPARRDGNCVVLHAPPTAAHRSPRRWLGTNLSPAPGPTCTTSRTCPSAWTS